MENRLITVAFVVFVMGFSIHVVSSQTFSTAVPCSGHEACEGPRLPAGAHCQSGFCICPDRNGVPKNCSLLESAPRSATNPPPTLTTPSTPTTERTTIRIPPAGSRTCKADKDCDPPFEFCNTTRSQCGCKPGYVMSTAIRQCLLVADTLHSNCTEDLQCQKNLGNAACTNGTCVCSNGFHESSNKCWKSALAGESCTHNEECYIVPGSECLSSTSRCTCFVGAVASLAGDECLLTASGMFDRCHEKSQCTARFNNSDCIGGQCNCDKSYRYNATMSQCVSTPSLGENCMMDFECVQPEDEGMSGAQICFEKICACNTSFVQVGDKCTAGAASLVPGLLTILSAILFFSRS